MLLRSKIRRLPPVHQATLKALLEHLARVVAFSDKNKMDPKNLAIVFGGVIFGEDDLPKGGDLMSVQSWKDSVMEDLIIHAHILYDEHPNFQPPNSPPLPPTPAGEPVPIYTYGSKTTKVASVPPTPTAAAIMAAQQQQVPGSPQDFTPRLPSRPASSIHPSLRANPQTPTRGRSDPPPPLPLRPGNLSPEETPPPSPSISSTVYETDDSTSPVQDLTAIGSLRPTSPLRSTTTSVDARPPEPQQYHSHPDSPPSLPPVV
ncbi:hypothetical protein H0H81_012711 [Sphagnurus paluster]|uniref:Rho-GAP domain-containing protein n=1 Tax=Sphagnurus paluster TaxID=117069 RepID=A0A9P7KI67_9AGAR|nr:hypothetical protein H0H81_012711 [Sphagnurus paluster]